MSVDSIPGCIAALTDGSMALQSTAMGLSALVQLLHVLMAVFYLASHLHQHAQAGSPRVLLKTVKQAVAHLGSIIKRHLTAGGLSLWHSDCRIYLRNVLALTLACINGMP